MKVTCPSCGAGGSIALFIADADARQAVFSAAKLPSDCGTWVLKYITLFSPAERFLTQSRAAKLITECCDMLLNGVDFDRQRLQAPSHVWRKALMQMMDASNIQRPLKNHHYLLRIVQSELGKRDDAQRHEQHQERMAEARTHTTSMQKVGEVMEAPTIAHDPLAEVSAERRTELFKEAEKILLGEGFKPPFLGAPLIEQKAREMLMEVAHA